MQLLTGCQPRSGLLQLISPGLDATVAEVDQAMLNDLLSDFHQSRARARAIKGEINPLLQIGDLVLVAKSQRNGSTYIPPTKLTPKYIGPFQVVATDPARMQATCTAFTTIPDRVNDLTTHVRFIKRLSSNFKGDLALFRRSADIDFPDDEIEALCQLMFDEHDQIFIEVKYYL